MLTKHSSFMQVCSVTLWPRDFIFNPLHVCAAQHIQILTKTRQSMRPHPTPYPALHSEPGVRGSPGLWSRSASAEAGRCTVSLLPQPWSLTPSPLCMAVWILQYGACCDSSFQWGLFTQKERWDECSWRFYDKIKIPTDLDFLFLPCWTTKAKVMFDREQLIKRPNPLGFTS